MTGKIFTKNDNTFEYKINNDTYKFEKSDEEDENEDGDRITEYLIVFTFTSGTEKPRTYVKRYRENKNDRDNFFKQLNPHEISDFTGWEPY